MMFCKSCGKQTLHQRNELVDASSLNNLYPRDLVNYLGVNASMAYDCQACFCSSKSLGLFSMR